MKTCVTLLFLLVLLASETAAQGPAKIDREALLELTTKKSDTTFVINFWATWCSPCVKEIDYFEDLHRLNQGKKLKVILVSLDFPDRADIQLLPFLRDKSISAHVVLMADLDYNSWIEDVDPGWSGAIPATLFQRGENRIFHEGELSREELNDFVNQISE